MKREQKRYKIKTVQHEKRCDMSAAQKKFRVEKASI